MHRNTRTAAVLLGLAVSIATSQAMPQMTAEASVPDIQLHADQAAIPLELRISTRGEVDAADVTHLDIDIWGENAGQESAVLSLYVLEEAWTGAVPAGVKPDDQISIRGALGDEPAHLSAALHATLDGAPTQHIALVLEGEADVQAELGLQVIATFADELPAGGIALEVVR